MGPLGPRESPLSCFAPCFALRTSVARGVLHQRVLGAELRVEWVWLEKGDAVPDRMQVQHEVVNVARVLSFVSGEK